MAKKRAARRKQPPPPPAARPGVTAERFSRLFRMLHFLGSATRTREWLTDQLGLDVRGFYRDLEFLRGVGISVLLGEEGYALQGKTEAAVTRLPFPDPHLTLGEVRQLARGKSQAHTRLRKLIDELQS
jgi:hypothetical protein